VDIPAVGFVSVISLVTKRLASIATGLLVLRVPYAGLYHTIAVHGNPPA
jgi:hypothetical protein